MHVHLSRALLAYFYDVPVLLGKSLLENATLLGSQLREVELINGRSFDSLAEKLAEEDLDSTPQIQDLRQLTR